MDTEQTDQKRFVVVSLKSWVFIAALQGLMGGVVAAVIAIVWYVAKAEWIEAISSPLSIIGTVLVFFVTALIGYPLYSWLASRHPAITVITGTFEEPPNDFPSE
jgi:hypothetical protein